MLSVFQLKEAKPLKQQLQMATDEQEKLETKNPSRNATTNHFYGDGMVRD